jgi:hypothetical protein
VSLDLDEIRERALLTRDGFYHVVGAHRVMREADFDALVAEVERLRAQRALDNDALARAWDEGRDMERAASVAFLREGDTVCMECGDRAALDLAYRIERGDHRREETTP